MKQRDYDPDFTHSVMTRRKTARLAILGCAFLFLLFAVLVAAIVVGLNQLLGFL